MSERVSSVVVFAGGGTGGHLYPGIAIAEEVRRTPGTRCLFLCSDRPLDAEILRKAGEEFVASPASPMVVRPRAFARFLRTWGKAVREARRLLRDAKAQAGEGNVVLVAMGGFVAAPAAQAARVERVPVLLVNLDAVPGKANRFVARRARGAGNGGVVTTIPVRGDSNGEWEAIGPIVRRQALAQGAQEECRRRLGLDPSLPVLMVTGGSQGAKSINALMTAVAGAHAGDLRSWQVLHQCGKGEADGTRAGYMAAGLTASRVRVQEFSDAMGDWWGAAELAVCRAGAGSVAEAWANGVATVFLPYPYHKDEHQRWNAEPLARAGACVLERDLVRPDANLGKAGAAIAGLVRDPAARDRMRTALRALGPASGAVAAAERVRRSLAGSAQSARGRSGA
jgi:UDP-N-acetylglucosamine:LPS N-acetylglucosamine transferase